VNAIALTGIDAVNMLPSIASVKNTGLGSAFVKLFTTMNPAPASAAVPVSASSRQVADALIRSMLGNSAVRSVDVPAMKAPVDVARTPISAPSTASVAAATASPREDPAFSRTVTGGGWTSGDPSTPRPAATRERAARSSVVAQTLTDQPQAAIGTQTTFQDSKADESTADAPAPVKSNVPAPRADVAPEIPNEQVAMAPAVKENAPRQVGRPVLPAACSDVRLPDRKDSRQDRLPHVTSPQTDASPEIAKTQITTAPALKTSTPIAEVTRPAPESQPITVTAPPSLTSAPPPPAQLPDLVGISKTETADPAPAPVRSKLEKRAAAAAPKSDDSNAGPQQPQRTDASVPAVAQAPAPVAPQVATVPIATINDVQEPASTPESTSVTTAWMSAQQMLGIAQMNAAPRDAKSGAIDQAPLAFSADIRETQPQGPREKSSPEPAVIAADAKPILAPHQHFEAAASNGDLARSYTTDTARATSQEPVARSATPVASAAETLRTSEPAAAPEAPKTQAGSAVQEIAVKIGRPEAPNVDLHVTERAGEIHVAVRTPDVELQTSLRQDLGSLASSLERAGFHAETFIPRAAAGAQMSFREERQAGQGSQQGSGGRGESPDEGSNGRGKREQRGKSWLEELEQSK